MDCLGISSLHSLLPAWLKWLFATPSNSDPSSRSSSCNTSSTKEGRNPLVSHRSSVHSRTDYISGITMLPSPHPICLSATSKSAMHQEVDGYQGCEKPLFSQVPPIPREPSPALHGRSIISSPISNTHTANQPMEGSSQYTSIGCFFFFCGVWCTNLMAWMKVSRLNAF